MKGAADKAGTKADSEHVLRYIITRPCLSEGQLHLLKYLQPYFPDEGTVTFQDSRGDTFAATVEAGRRLTGLGELYRAHHLGVNDVLLLTPRPNSVYDVECVVKPHARPATATERPAPTPLATEKRVVIHATPHVREVRMERVSAAEAGQPSQATPTPRPSSSNQSAPGQTAPTQAAQTTSAPRPPAQAEMNSAPASQHSPETGKSGPRPAPPPPAVSTSAFQTPAFQTQPPSQAQGRANQGSGGQSPAALLPSLTGGNPSAARLQPSSPSEALTPAARAGNTAPEVPSAATKTAPVALAVKPTSEARSAPSTPVATPIPLPPQTTEQQLAQLAQLTGYTFEHLGDGVTRLRANLGEQSYSVLLALTPGAMQAPAWSERADYKALLTAEDERPQGTARFTQAALTSLLEHARLAPLTPVDLRGYWNTGSFDHRSVESVAELVSAHLAQRGIFSHVLMTLAQQPAHSLVQPARLAERLGSGVNTAELQSILETLSRPPFMALTPLPGGQYYLRGDVRDLLGEVGDYAEGMRRRLK